jgi:hypothetical protein
MFAHVTPTAVVFIGALAGVVGGSFAILTIFLVRMLSSDSQSLFGKLFRGRLRAEQAVAEFSRKVADVNNQRQLLSVYSAEYFSTFKEAGWDDLDSLVEDLVSINCSLNQLLSDRRYGEVEEVCEYLMGRCDAATAEQLQEEYEGLSSVQGWQERTREALVKLVDALKESAEITVSIGVQRNRSKRKPTLLSLEELKGSLHHR